MKKSIGDYIHDGMQRFIGLLHTTKSNKQQADGKPSAFIMQKNGGKSMKDLTTKEITAVKEALETIGRSTDDATVSENLADNTVTINVGKDGRTYAWLLEEDGGAEALVDVETLKTYTDAEEISEIIGF